MGQVGKVRWKGGRGLRGEGSKVSKNTGHCHRGLWDILSGKETIHQQLTGRRRCTMGDV